MRSGLHPNRPAPLFMRSELHLNRSHTALYAVRIFLQNNRWNFPSISIGEKCTHFGLRRFYAVNFSPQNYRWNFPSISIGNNYTLFGQICTFYALMHMQQKSIYPLMHMQPNAFTLSCICSRVTMTPIHMEQKSLYGPNYIQQKWIYEPDCGSADVPLRAWFTFSRHGFLNTSVTLWPDAYSADMVEIRGSIGV